jgi:ABC-type glycerol-3-phosphate transport system permease component
MTSTPLTSPQHVFLEKVAARSRARRFLNVGSYNLLAWIVLAIYLLPVACMLVTALKSTDQLSDNKAPWYPSKIST